MNILQIIAFIPLFLVVSIIAFYIPGRVILGNREKKNGIVAFTCSLVIGLVLWGWQGFVLGYLQLRFLSYGYLLVFLALFIKQQYYKVKFKKPKYIDWPSVLLVIIGSFGQTIAFFPSGFSTSQGLTIAKYNPPDHLWHTSLINEIAQRFPPQEPGMYGILLSNYHYWFNLITAELIRVFHLPLLQTQYIGMYVLGSILLGLSAYVFSTTILKSKAFVRWILFFLYFGADASYFLSFITVHQFNFVIPSVIEHSTLFMDNPPRAYSIVILFIALYFIFTEVRSIEKKYFFIIAILAGTLIGFKVYTGMTILASLFALSAFHAYHRRWRTFFISLSALVFSLVIFIPVNAHSGGIFFNPFDRPRDFITYKPLGLNDLQLRWIVYVVHKNYPRLFEYGIIMTIIYFFAQFGIRLIGFVPYKKTFSLLGKEKIIVLYTGLLFPILFGLFFSQKAHASDSFNFFVSGLLFLTILTAIHLSLFLEKKKIELIAIVVLAIALIMLPRWIYEEKFNIQTQYFSNTFNGVSYAELTSYDFLKKMTNPDSMVLVINKNHIDQTSAIVSIFSDRHMYLSGLGVIQAHDAENKKRSSTVYKIETNNDSQVVLDLLNKAHIDYVYLYNGEKIGKGLKILLKNRVFHNNAASIFKI